MAKTLLYKMRRLRSDPITVEDVCLACSQEFYDNATSGNYHFGDMKLAYDWCVPFLLSDWTIQS